MGERERIVGKTDDGQRVVVGATSWQRLVLRSSSSRVGAWRALPYSIFAVAFALCDVAEAIREQSAASSASDRPSTLHRKDTP